MAEFQRARTPEQQEERRAAILGAAREMLDDGPLADISLRELARRVGLAKSNVVRYLPTREAVFLEVLAEDWDDWLDGVEAALPKPDRRRSRRTTHRRVAEALVACTAARPRWAELVVAHAAVLERNVPDEVARRFKQRTLGQTERLAGLLRGSVPDLGEEDAFFLAGAVVAVVAGAWPLTHPSPTVERVLGDPALAALRVPFGPAVTRVLAALLDGVAAQL